MSSNSFRTLSLSTLHSVYGVSAAGGTRLRIRVGLVNDAGGKSAEFAAGDAVDDLFTLGSVAADLLIGQLPNALAGFGSARLVELGNYHALFLQSIEHTLGVGDEVLVLVGAGVDRGLRDKVLILLRQTLKPGEVRHVLAGVVQVLREGQVLLNLEVILRVDEVDGFSWPSKVPCCRAV